MASPSIFARLIGFVREVRGVFTSEAVPVPAAAAVVANPPSVGSFELRLADGQATPEELALAEAITKGLHYRREPQLDWSDLPDVLKDAWRTHSPSSDQPLSDEALAQKTGFSPQDIAEFGYRVTELGSKVVDKDGNIVDGQDPLAWAENIRPGVPAASLAEVQAEPVRRSIFDTAARLKMRLQAVTGQFRIVTPFQEADPKAAAESPSFFGRLGGLLGKIKAFIKPDADKKESVGTEEVAAKATISESPGIPNTIINKDIVVGRDANDSLIYQRTVVDRPHVVNDDETPDGQPVVHESTVGEYLVGPNEFRRMRRPDASRGSSKLHNLKLSEAFASLMAFEPAMSKLKSISEHRLTQKFAAVANATGMKLAFKFASAGLAGAAGANVYGVALAGGLGVTIGEAILEYRDHLRKQAEQAEREKGFKGFFKNIGRTVRGFFGFVNQNRGEFLKKLGMNSGLGLLGAGVGAGIKEVWDSGGRDVFESVSFRLSNDWSGFKSFFGFGEALKPEVPVEMPTASPSAVAIIHTPDGAAFEVLDGHVEQINPSVYVPAEPAAEPAAVEPASVPEAPEFSLDSINTDGWSDKALADLEAAQKGAPWALQNLAHYAANGLQGMSVDLDAARELATQAKVAGSPLAENFLADLDGRALEVPVADAAPAAAVADATVVPVTEFPAITPTLDSFRALNDLENVAWAQNNQALKDTIAAARGGSAQAWKDLAHEAMQAGDPVSAYTMNQEALERNPDLGQAKRFAEDLMNIPSAREAIEAAKEAAEEAAKAAAEPLIQVLEPSVQVPVEPVVTDSNKCRFTIAADQSTSLACDNLATMIASNQSVVVDVKGCGLSFVNNGTDSTSVRGMVESINARLVNDFVTNNNGAEILSRACPSLDHYMASAGNYDAAPAAPGISN